MRYVITEEDKMLFLQGDLEYKYRLNVKDKNRIKDVLYGISQVGSYSINGQSDVRRNIDITLLLDEIYNIEHKIESWMGLEFELEIGIYSILKGDFIWYPCGTYLITDASTQYNATTNTLTLSMSDMFSKFDGTRNGQIGGAPVIRIPVETDDGEKTVLRDALTTVVKQQGGIDNVIIDDIGEFYGMEGNNSDYLEYRKNNPEWNILPYDLEFNVGCTVSEPINEITSLYPNIQKYFDVYNNFCCHMIPSCENSSITLSNDFLQSIVLSDSSEDVTYDIQSIKNVTEVFGMIYDVDRMAEESTTSENIYSITLEEYEKYTVSEYIAIVPNTNNVANMHLKINNLESVPIYYENTDKPIAENTMLASLTYVLQLKKIDDKWRFYYLGQYQPHAICVLTSTDSDPVYTKEYFSERYNCKNIVMRVEPDSPFSVQKLGVVLDVKSGDRYENIKSDSVAIENAIYENIKSSSWNDVVTINTLCVPWLDVYDKVEWKKTNTDKPEEYIIQNVSHNLSGNAPTSTITMYRFHPLYYDYEIPY